MEQTKVPVSWRSLLQRLNRRLAHEGRILKKSREGHALAELGTYYVLDRPHNAIVAHHVDPQALAETYHILQPWEALLDEG